MVIRRLGALMVAIVCLTGINQPLLRGQNKKEPHALNGKVLDQSGAAINGARVLLVDRIGRVRVVTTDEAGAFSFSDITEEHYSLEVTAAGFSPYELDDLALTAQADRKVEVVLKVAATSASVDVAERSHELGLERNSSASSIVIKGKLLRSLPHDEERLLRYLQELAGPAAATTGNGQPQIVVNGLSGGRLPPLDTIKEIRINSDPYSAQYHEPGQARIEIETKSGSENFEASLTLFYGNSIFDGRNSFDQQRLPYDQNNITGWFSGPLPGRKSEFYSYLERHDGSDAVGISAVVPTDLDGRPRTPLKHIFGDSLAPLSRTHGLAGVDDNLSARHKFSLEYNFTRGDESNQGIGGLELQERNYRGGWHEHSLRLTEDAVLSESAVNNLELQLSRRDLLETASNMSPNITVPGSFSGGGASCCPNSRIEERIEFADNLSVIYSKQNITGGAQADIAGFRVNSRSGFLGSYTFSSLSNFIAKRADIYEVNIGDPFVGLNLAKAAYYIQDNIKLMPNLNVSLGLRHELQNHLNDFDDFAPRLGIAWSPLGSQTTVVRAGTGVFYGLLGEDILGDVDRFANLRQREIVVLRPAFPTSLTTSQLLDMPPSLSLLAPNARTPYSLQSSLSIEHEFPLGVALSGTYTFIRGNHFFRLRDINAPLPETGVRPNPDFLNMDQYEPTANSTYHGLTVGFSETIGEFLTLLGNYTLSRTMDDMDSPSTLPADNFNLRAEWARASSDRRHQFFTGAVFSLPLELQASMYLSLASAQPFNITSGQDLNHDTVFNDRPDGVGRNSGKGAPYANLDLRLSKRFSFNLPQVRQSGKANPNDSEKSFGMEFAIEGSNVLNRTNLEDFIGVLSSSLFGRANAAADPRQVKFQLTFSFR